MVKFDRAAVGHGRAMARKADGNGLLVAILLGCSITAGMPADGTAFAGAPLRLHAPKLESLYQQCLPVSFYQKCLPPMRICMSGHVETHRQALLRAFDQQLILAPLTRGGNLPFRRLCAVRCRFALVCARGLAARGCTF